MTDRLETLHELSDRLTDVPAEAWAVLQQLLAIIGWIISNWQLSLLAVFLFPVAWFVAQWWLKLACTHGAYRLIFRRRLEGGAL